MQVHVAYINYKHYIEVEVEKNVHINFIYVLFKSYSFDL